MFTIEHNRMVSLKNHIKGLLLMQIEKHTLLKDFPEHQHTICHLKINDNHFAKLFDEYHEIENEVHHIEKNYQPVTDKYLESLKKHRVHLKDQLFILVVKKESAL
ncbi:MAG: hypothetical protein ACJASL_004839 [Paraglaciecola sp.]|jgi:uncharacterized protein YdcH (DUF465 family)